jgi:L-ascorbate metabolism protein UlaG (beta-lactamase superfamily)
MAEDIRLNPTIRYYGWSALCIETANDALLFDPFYRKYCGAQWFTLEDFAHATVVCATHGHEEHYLDIPAVIKRSGATVVAHRTVCDYLKWRNHIAPEKLVPIGEFETRELRGFRISAFKWKHRDINLYKALARAVFQGNSAQLSWAWSSASKAPFYAPYMVPSAAGRFDYHNYSEGFNTKMTDREITELGRRYRQTCSSPACSSISFQMSRAAAALNRIVVLPAHDHFHRIWAISEPWTRFADAVRARLPAAQVVIAEPGTAVDVASGAVSQRQPSVWAA